MFKSGFVGIIGRANVGKSTFLNLIIGKKIAITSDKPQTTRNRILGILSTDDYQIAFTDTPGVHKPKNELDNRMQEASFSSVKGVDAIIFMTTPLKEVLKGDLIILENLKKTNIPVFLVINKIDILKNKNDIDQSIVLYKDLFKFEGIYPISASMNINVEHLMNDILKIIPEGPMYYPADMLSDHSERFLISELIREKILFLTKEEVPHSIAVVVENMKACEENSQYTDIYATIYVERDSQKKIIVGAGGNMIKTIKEKAIMDIKHLINTKVHLELFVKVKKDWRDRPNDLNSLGYSKDSF